MWSIEVSSYIVMQTILGAHVFFSKCDIRKATIIHEISLAILKQNGHLVNNTSFEFHTEFKKKW